MAPDQRLATIPAEYQSAKQTGGLQVIRFAQAFLIFPSVFRCDPLRSGKGLFIDQGLVGISEYAPLVRRGISFLAGLLIRHIGTLALDQVSKIDLVPQNLFDIPCGPDSIPVFLLF